MFDPSGSKGRTPGQGAKNPEAESLFSLGRPKKGANLPFFTARAYARAVLGVVILSVRPSVRPSDTRVDCDKTK